MSFLSDIKKFTKKAQLNIDKVGVATATIIFTSVIIRTLVDTGRARANWIYTQNTASPDIVENIDFPKLNITPTKKHILANNLPYIHVMEDGDDKRPPHGMVKLSIMEFQGVVKKQARKIK